VKLKDYDLMKENENKKNSIIEEQNTKIQEIEALLTIKNKL
jgi:hypothetical protein